jgi:hypothetical protein
MIDLEMADIENVFEALALTVDRVRAEQGADRIPLFLAKAALALAQALNDPSRACAIITTVGIPDPDREKT